MRNLLFVFILLSCHATAPSSATSHATDAATTPGITKITFNTSTRGYQRETSFTKDSVIIHITSTFEASAKTNWRTKLTSEEWERLMTSLKGVDVTQIEELKPPTIELPTDGALQSSIEITKGNTYTHRFDETEPNAQLKQLMNVIGSIEKSRMNE